VGGWGGTKVTGADLGLAAAGLGCCCGRSRIKGLGLAWLLSRAGRPSGGDWPAPC
jgi:hypothetical protein